MYRWQPGSSGSAPCFITRGPQTPQFSTSPTAAPCFQRHFRATQGKEGGILSFDLGINASTGTTARLRSHEASCLPMAVSIRRIAASQTPRPHCSYSTSMFPFWPSRRPHSSHWRSRMFSIDQHSTSHFVAMAYRIAAQDCMQTACQFCRDIGLLSQAQSYTQGYNEHIFPLLRVHPSLQSRLPIISSLYRTYTSPTVNAYQYRNTFSCFDLFAPY